MIYLSFVVPSYNAEKYLDRCVPSLVIGGEDVEIIIVNDGSKDNTLQIAKSYAEKYSNVKVIDKENGGHGSGINAALKIATGLYFKCVDADDWADEEAYKKLLNTIKQHHSEGKSPDLYLTNFVYNRLDDGITSMHDFSKTYPVNKLMTWEDLKNPNNADFFMMHMFVYKLEILKKANLSLLEHTFYVDNQYVYEPLYYVKSIYYLPVPFYQYYVGHADQSISYTNMAKNYKHDFRVYEKVMNTYTLEDINKLTKAHKKYMLFALVVNSALALFYYVCAKKNGSKNDYKPMLKRIKKNNGPLYKKARHGTRFEVTYLLIPPLRDIATKIGYKIVKKKTGWY